MFEHTNTVRFSNIVFTAFVEPSIDCYNNIQYMIYQKEKCPSTNKIHFQGYCELKNRMTLFRIKNELFKDNTIHIENRRGSQEQAIKYCSKKESQVEPPITYGIPRRQGARTDLDEIAALAPHTSIRTLIALFGGNALRHINMIRRYQEMIYNPDPIELGLRRAEIRGITDPTLISIGIDLSAIEAVHNNEEEA